MRWSRFWPTPSAGRSILVASILIVTLGFYLREMPEPFFDFRAFYCAGEAERTGMDPYREHPLHECERRLSAPGVPAIKTAATIPAPFPGYVLALFAVVAWLPFAPALVLWAVGSLGALTGSIVLVARSTRTPLAATAIAVGFPAAVVAVPLGQVTPFVLFAIVSCATLLESNRPRLAALVALGSMLDPHVGLALCFGLFVNVRGTRAVLAFGGAALLVVGILVSGAGREWEYVAAVVPAHALANVSDATQFSITNIAYTAGMKPATALIAGSLWFIAALGVGTVVAQRLGAHFGAATFAYVPLAFAVFGGMHTHLTQLALALPAFLLVRSGLSGRSRDWWIVAAFVAAVPWLPISPFPNFYLIPCLLAYLFASEIRDGTWGLRLAAGSFVILQIALIAIVSFPVARTLAGMKIEGNPLADVSWQNFMIAQNTPPQTWSLFAKTPTIVAFVLLLVTLLLLSMRRPAAH